LPIPGKRGDAFRRDLASLDDKAMTGFHRLAQLAVDRAAENRAAIVLIGDASYPPNLWASNNPVPILYARGALDVFGIPQAGACVGYREIRSAYQERQAEFSAYAARTHRVVVSGFALGADTIAHRAARDVDGPTICVMPCGLDRNFPPENRRLRDELLG